jgi:hypothetical protein
MPNTNLLQVTLNTSKKKKKTEIKKILSFIYFLGKTILVTLKTFEQINSTVVSKFHNHTKGSFTHAIWI